MPNNVRHFSINANDVSRARSFYEKVLGWTFQPWGPPGFLLCTTGTKDDPGVPGSLQKRREIVPGKPTYGLECTVGVDDVDRVAADVQKHGGRIVMPRVTITTVGHLIFFEDPEGNILGAMQYDPKAE